MPNVIDGFDLFGLAVAVAPILVSICFFVRFLRWRTGYDLGLLIIFVTLSVFGAVLLIAPKQFASIETALLEHFPGGPDTRRAVRISMYVLVGLLIVTYRFLAEIKRLLGQGRGRLDKQGDDGEKRRNG
ncbi:MAG: hypothetical protein HY673_03385 [Chloroflexi bacterium]|nr:hypothetical protein [Chloroflexota bacterium]